MVLRICDVSENRRREFGNAVSVVESKGKDNGRPGTGTEALYRPYSP